MNLGTSARSDRPVEEPRAGHHPSHVAAGCPGAGRDEQSRGSIACSATYPRVGAQRGPASQRSGESTRIHQRCEVHTAMALTTADLRDWLERKYDMYFVEPRPLYGTYGQIWFLNARGTHQIPEGFAVKTVAPERVFDVRSAVDADYLRREFRIWLSLPPTANVLPALGFDVACLHEVSSGSEILLPVMRMPRMAGSLQEWIDLEQPIATADRLLALAQAVNGLMFMYENGIQGHGDLKPQNILFEELSMRFALSEGGAWPSVEHPWRIRIADLGWADAWTDLGFSNKALRQYLAPERLDGHVEPKLSDIFAMGLITAELLQGRHPAPNLPKVLSSDGKVELLGTQWAPRSGWHCFAQSEGTDKQQS